MLVGMKRIAVMAVLLIGGAVRADNMGAMPAQHAAPSAPWRAPGTPEIAIHVLASAAIVLDVWSSFDIKNHRANGTRCDSCYGLEETMPLLGKHPGDLRLVYMGLASLAATTALWYVFPQQVRWAVDVGIMVVEVPVVGRNMTSHGLQLTIPFG